MDKIDYLMTAIRSIGASFPVATTIVNGWNEVQGRLENERIKKYIEAVMKRLNEVELKTEKTKEDMARMFYYAMNYAVKDPLTEKSELYAGSLIEYCSSDIEVEEALSLIQELETLNASDVDILKKISPGGRIDERLGLTESSTPIEVSSCQVSVKKLESKALIGLGGDNSNELHRDYNNPDAWPFTFYTQYYVVLHSGTLVLKIWNKHKTA